MFRFKAVFGGRLWARTFENQQVEAAIKCAAPNRMTGLGMGAPTAVFLVAVAYLDLARRGARSAAAARPPPGTRQPPLSPPSPALG